MTFTTSDANSPAAVGKGSTWVQSHSSYSYCNTSNSRSTPPLSRGFYHFQDFPKTKNKKQGIQHELFKVACQNKSCIKLPKMPTKKCYIQQLKFQVCRTRSFQIEFSLCNKLWLHHRFTLMAAPKFHKCPSHGRNFRGSNAGAVGWLGPG